MASDSPGIDRATVETLRIDERRKLVYVGACPLQLSRKEFDLLRLLASDPGRAFSTRRILEALWTDRERASGADVRQSVYMLRRRIETDPRDPKRIETVKGSGYRLTTPIDS